MPAIVPPVEPQIGARLGRVAGGSTDPGKCTTARIRGRTLLSFSPMRTWTGLLLCACACACGGPLEDTEPRSTCLVDAEPDIRFGRDLGDGFVELDDREAIEAFASPQGGFGVLLDLQTRGVGSGPDHRVLVEIVGELDGESIADYRLDGAPLMCDEEGPGRWGTMLLTLDQDRFQTLDDLEDLADRDVRLQAELADEAGNVAWGERTVHIRTPH